MKRIPILFSILFMFLAFTATIMAQVNLATFAPNKNKDYILETTDGTTFIGKILSYDAREALIKTADKGELIIPKHQIRSIALAEDVIFDSKGKYLPEERFATRYFITTNGLPIKKGEHYAQINWYGPDLEFAVSDNFGLGVMTSWVAIPIIATAKYTIKLTDKWNMAVGGLLGTGSWAGLQTGGALPYASITWGDRRSNFTLTGGYAVLWEEFLGDENEGEFLCSVAAMTKVSPKWSLVFDSFIIPDFDGEGFGGALLIPGIRYQSTVKNALQFGFAGMISGGDAFPVPIPMAQWYLRL